MTSNKATKPKVEDLDKVMYGYSVQNNAFEEENRMLRESVGKLREELERLNQPALMVCEVSDITEKNAIIKVPNGNMFYVNISENCKDIAPGDNVLVEQKNLNILKKIDVSQRFNVEKYVIIEKPTIKWSDIGGLEDQIRELQEVIELPLKKPELFKKVGILPPKGVLLYGEPGTGKTLLAKAVAASTNATFIELVGSELVQKFIGEGAKLVKEIFQLAKKKAPAIIFIDELDALASRRIDVGTSGEREVQRTFMQLLAEIDGFKHLGDVKVIGCTNRKDILDPAIIRPGRLDRMVEVPLPNEDGIREIFKIHTKNMSVGKSDNEKLIKDMVGFSGAEIQAVCTEAGYFAIRANRTTVNNKDFTDAVKKIRQKDYLDGEDYRQMFG